MRPVAVLAVSVVIMVMAIPALAFNKPAHKVSGAIAYNILSRENPNGLQKAISLLKQHPYYEEHWKNELATLPEPERDRGLFMLAAAWPDVVRSDRQHPEYNHPIWHYTDEPFKPADQPDSVKTSPPDDENIMAAFERFTHILENTSETPQNRAIAICWIFHLIGDIHQPCHTTSLFTTEYPRGDKGGNLVFIKARADATTIRLHQFWDDLILGSEDLRDASNCATELVRRPSFAMPMLVELDRQTCFEQWKDASVRLAKEFVYCNGRMTGSPHKNSATVLSREYIKTAKTTGERQIVLAGYRIAEVMTILLK
jgi:hypothetical protein